MRHLTTRMNAGVGPARALHMHALAGEGEHGILQRRLDRWAAVLPLPADEWATVVLDRDLVARHGSAGLGLRQRYDGRRGQDRAGRQSEAAQERIGRLRRPSGALQLQQAQATAAAGHDRKAITTDSAGA